MWRYRVQGGGRDELIPALQRVVDQKKPTIVDIVVDANEAPLPPHLTFGHITGYAKHMVKEMIEGKMHLPTF